VTALFPPVNGQSVCPDPPLRLTFPGPPTLGSAGKIQVFKASQPGTAVATVDLGAASWSDTRGGTTFNLTRPAFVDGNDAVIYLSAHALGYGQTYYVTVDAGAVVGPGATPVSITGTTAWRFTTAAAAPSSLASISVALDGSGEFCSVQGAVDALPAKNSAAALITIGTGTYHEIVHFTAKNNVTLHGVDRHGTILAGTNNNNLNPSTATRALVGVDNSTGLVVENLTIHNLTPQGGSQAEALRLQGCDQCVVRDADILSRQDTLLWSGRVYAKNCYVEGNVDFVWGTGTAYFDGCELKTVGEAGFNVQARNPASTYGYVFVGSKLTSDPGITGDSLARIDESVYPASHVAYVNCQMGSHISAAGWTITGGAAPPSLRFWEYQSTDPSGKPIDTSKRITGSTQITAAQAAMMSNPATVLGGWQPP
jgi:pectin methylesterase-like acyl-CoA thioesterase